LSHAREHASATSSDAVPDCYSARRSTHAKVPAPIFPIGFASELAAESGIRSTRILFCLFETRASLPRRSARSCPFGHHRRAMRLRGLRESERQRAGAEATPPADKPALAYLNRTVAAEAAGRANPKRSFPDARSFRRRSVSPCNFSYSLSC